MLAELPATRGTLVGLLVDEPSALVATTSFGSEKLNVSLSVDGAGLIVGLRISPAASASSWSSIDRTLAAIAPNVGFLAARVSKGSCQPIHQVASSTPRPLASEFKLFVLGALAHQVATGRIEWNQELTVQSQLKSSGNPVGSGSLQFSPAGTKVSVREAAIKMISISDKLPAHNAGAVAGAGAVSRLLSGGSAR